MQCVRGCCQEQVAGVTPPYHHRLLSLTLADSPQVLLTGSHTSAHLCERGRGCGVVGGTGRRPPCPHTYLSSSTARSGPLALPRGNTWTMLMFASSSVWLQVQRWVVVFCFVFFGCFVFPDCSGLSPDKMFAATNESPYHERENQ